MSRPRILVTRRWPQEVEAEMTARFDVVLNESDEPLDQQALATAMDEFDIICPTVSDTHGCGRHQWRQPGPS